jgi:predicted acylesterase/phospholipase RssA
MRQRAIAVAAIGTFLSGCATRGAIDISCDNFEAFRQPLKPSQLVLDIQHDAGGHPVAVASAPAHGPMGAVVGGPMAALPSDPMARSMAKLMLAPLPAHPGPMGRAVGVTDKPRAVLLLSGGGQWGAFGAGLLQKLKELGGDKHVDFGVITGVSTGGVQSLFVAIDSPAAYKALAAAYSPEKESDVVDRNSKPLTIFTGSLAGLKPLRRRIEAALCTDGNSDHGCPLIDALANANRQVYIGFIKASTGEFIYADAVAIAKSGSGETVTAQQRRNAQQCLTGVALASAAMPVFYQQVKINHETYYDGGVRKSVFEARIAENLENGVQAVRKTYANAVSPPLYVIRNGPTQLLDSSGKPGSDDTADHKGDALTAAFRAESIVVNELEIGSVAALRLSHPTGPIRLATADGYDTWPDPKAPVGDPGCKKPQDVMFDPEFMLCLQRLGRNKAERTAPLCTWIDLSETAASASPVTAACQP